MESFIFQSDEKDEYMTDEGCYILELSNSSKDENVSIARARLEPGKRTVLHRLRNIEERYIILQGSGCVEIGDLPQTYVTVGDVVLIPSEITQMITNTGNNDLVFLCVCSPRFRNQFYEDLESSTK